MGNTEMRGNKNMKKIVNELVEKSDVEMLYILAKLNIIEDL
jgi:hypothetical protein